MQPTIIMTKTYVEGCVNWLFPANVIFSAMPKALIAIIETEPVVEQMERYISGFLRPYLGAIL